MFSMCSELTPRACIPNTTIYAALSLTCITKPDEGEDGKVVDSDDGNDDADGHADNDDDALLPADTFLSNSHDSARLQVNREFRSNFT